MRATGADIIDLDLGNPDQPTPDAIVHELIGAARVGKNHRYHPGRGLMELREALCSWYKRRYHVDFDPTSEVIVTMGAKDGMTSLCLATLSQGDTVLVPDPCYPIHRGAPLIAGASVCSYPSTSKDPGAEIGRVLKDARERGEPIKLVVANYPQNPTGKTLTREQLRELVSAVHESGALLMHDLAYADLDFSTKHAPSIFDCGVPSDVVKTFAVEVFSVSKSYHMPGWRIGFVAGNASMLAALAHLKTYTDYGTFIPVQHAAAWALAHGDAFTGEIRELYRARAQALVSGLHRAGWDSAEVPGGTMFVWAPLPAPLSGMSSLEATQLLIEQAHVAVTPGSGFGAGGEGYVRFALIEDPPRIAEACRRIERVLKAQTPGLTAAGG